MKTFKNLPMRCGPLRCLALAGLLVIGARLVWAGPYPGGVSPHGHTSNSDGGILGNVPATGSFSVASGAKSSTMTATAISVSSGTSNPINYSSMTATGLVVSSSTAAGGVTSSTWTATSAYNPLYNTTNGANNGYQIDGSRTLPTMSLNCNNTTTTTNNTTTSYTATGVTITVNPHYTTSKFLIMASGHLVCGASASCYASIFGTTTGNIGPAGGICNAPSNGNTNCGMIYFDTPGSVAAQTYVVEIKSDASGQQASFPAQNGGSNGMGTICVQEFAN